MSIFDSFKLFRRSGSGKLPGKPTNTNQLVSKLYANNKVSEIDYNENNYDLFRAIYYNSTVNTVGVDYQIAAALGKPIVNIAAGYVLGKGFSVELDNPNNDSLIEQAEDNINQWVKDNEKIFLDIARHGYRDGDAYLHIDEYGQLSEYDARGVDEIIDPVSGKTIGFDVKRRVEETDKYGNNATSVIYVKQYRTDSIRIYRYEESQPENIGVLWEKMITRDGYKDIPRAEDGTLENIPREYIRERSLPVIALHNEPEAEAVYGNSDYQNLLSLFANYSGVIKAATKGSKYNAVPTLKIRGLSNPTTTEQKVSSGKSLAAQALDYEDNQEYQRSNKEGIEWGQDSVLYLSKDSDADFINGNGFMNDLSKVLEIYFYLFVQGSETPEYVFGTAVSSSKASTDSQAPVFITKIVRKQLEFQHFVQKVVNAYIERRALMSDYLYQQLVEKAPSVRVAFPPIDNDDVTLSFESVKWAYENNLITAGKALEIILSDRIKDVPQEVREAALEAKERAEAEPANSDRLLTTILKQTNNEAQASSQEAEPIKEMTGNPYHDQLGRFASKNTAGAGGDKSSSEDKSYGVSSMSVSEYYRKRSEASEKQDELRKKSLDLLDEKEAGKISDAEYEKAREKSIKEMNDNRIPSGISDEKTGTMFVPSKKEDFAKVDNKLNEKATYENIKKMSAEQKKAIEDYTGEYTDGSYKNVNDYLRNGNGSEATKKKAELVSNAIENSKLGSDMICFRGVDSDMFGDKKLSTAINQLKKGLEKGTVKDASKIIETIGSLQGKTIQDKGLMSSSPNYNSNYSNRDFTMRIHAKANTKACDITGLSKYGGKGDTTFGAMSASSMESEVLFAPNTKMKISKVTITDGGVCLDCDIL